MFGETSENGEGNRREFVLFVDTIKEKLQKYPIKTRKIISVVEDERDYFILELSR